MHASNNNESCVQTRCYLLRLEILCCQNFGCFNLFTEKIVIRLNKKDSRVTLTFQGTVCRAALACCVDLQNTFLVEICVYYMMLIICCCAKIDKGANTVNLLS